MVYADHIPSLIHIDVYPSNLIFLLHLTSVKGSHVRLITTSNRLGEKILLSSPNLLPAQRL